MTKRNFKMDQRNAYTVTYVDEEGDKVVKPVEMTQSEAMDLMERFRERGAEVLIHMVSGSGVKLTDEEEVVLDFPDRGGVR